MNMLFAYLAFEIAIHQLLAGSTYKIIPNRAGFSILSCTKNKESDSIKIVQNVSGLSMIPNFP